MKRLNLFVIVIIMTIVSCKKENSEDFRKFTTSSELWDYKDKLKNEDAYDYTNMIYKISLADSAVINNKNIERVALLDLFNRDSLRFGVGEVKNEEVLEMVKNSKSIQEFYNKAFSLEGLVGDNAYSHQVRSLTKDIISIHNIHLDGAGGGENLYKLSDAKYTSFDYEKEFQIEKTINKLNELHKTKFEIAMAKFAFYDKTTINGKEFITISLVDEITGNTGYKSNLFIASSTETNEKYYIYDDPRTKDDDWERDNEDAEWRSQLLPINNPKWILIK